MSNNLWQDMTEQQFRGMADLDKFAKESAPALWKQTVRQGLFAAVLAVTGLIALGAQVWVLGAALLLAAVHFDIASSKTNLMLVLTCYQGEIARLMREKQTEVKNPLAE